MGRRDKLIKAQSEYIEFLANHIGENAVYLHIHGIKPSDEAMAEGERLREEIKLHTGDK